jgi:hypothetical protein
MLERDDDDGNDDERAPMMRASLCAQARTGFSVAGVKGATPRSISSGVLLGVWLAEVRWGDSQATSGRRTLRRHTSELVAWRPPAHLPRRETDR